MERATKTCNLFRKISAKRVETQCCAFYLARSNWQVMQQIRLLQVARIMTSDWIKLRGSHAIQESHVTCLKTSLPWAGKTPTRTDFVAKSRTMSTFWNNFSQPAAIWFVARQIWTWVNEQLRFLTRFTIMIQIKLQVFVARYTFLLSLDRYRKKNIIGEKTTRTFFNGPIFSTCSPPMPI